MDIETETESALPQKNARPRNMFQVEVWNPETQTWTWTSNLMAQQPKCAARKSLQKLKKQPQYADSLQEYRVRVTQENPYRVKQQKVGFQEAWPSRKVLGLTRVPWTRVIQKSEEDVFDSYSQQNGPASDPNSTLGH